MSGYRIQLRPGARHTLLALDKPVRRRLQRAIDALATQPRPEDATTLSTHPAALRLRVGDYTIVYAPQNQDLLILVIDTSHHSTVHRRT